MRAGHLPPRWSCCLVRYHVRLNPHPLFALVVVFCGAGLPISVKDAVTSSSILESLVPHLVGQVHSFLNLYQRTNLHEALV